MNRAAYGTTRTTNPDGTLAAVDVPLGTVTPPAMPRVYLMVDPYPAVRDTIAGPP